jgi:4-amino-4-deoxy-L-arabinose transferase-like glycosyltransferase
VASFILKAYFDRPHGVWDAWAIWNYRARWLFLGESNWTHAFTYLNAADSPDYPLLVTGSVFRMWSILGTDHVAIPIVVAGVLAVGTILILFSSIGILRGENQGYLAALFMFIATQFLNVATYQYGDAPLSFFILSTIALFSLKDHHPDLSRRLLFLAGLTASCAAWTKNEGFLFLVLIILIRFIAEIRRRNWLAVFSQFLYFLLGMSFVLSTLIYFKLNFAIQNDLVNNANFSKLGVHLLDSDRYLKVLLGIAKYFFTFNDHIAILLIVYIFLSGVARSSFVKKGVVSHLFLMLFMLGGYAFSFFISPFDLTWHMSSALKRLSVQLWPAWVFIAFYCAKGPEKNLASEQGIKELTKTTPTIQPPG